MSNWISIYQTDNYLQAHCIKAMLEQNDIEVKTLGEALHGAIGELPAIGMNIRLYIFYAQKNRANTLINAFENASPIQWQCNYCREINESTFEICWHCSHDPLSSNG